MPLKLIHGPPNSGRAGRLREAFLAALQRDPVLLVPTADDAFSFERGLSGGSAVLGGSVMGFGALFRTVATMAGEPPGGELSAAQRLRVLAVAVDSRRHGLGPLRRSASRAGFTSALERLVDELQGAGLEPTEVEASAATLEGSAYLSDLATLYSAYEEARERTGLLDSHGIARRAIACLEADGSFWGGRPVLLYGFDDLTESQFALLAELTRLAEVTVALPYERGNLALAARGRLLEQLRDRIGGEEEATEARLGESDSPLLFHLARGFGSTAPTRAEPDGSLALLRSAGTRAEAEAIAGRVSRLIDDGAEPERVAVVLRDPGRRGPEVAAALEANGVATALETEVPVSGTSVGGALLALLRAEFGTGRAADLLRYLRGPSGFSAGRVDWFERRLRRERVTDAATGLRLWAGEEGEAPRDLQRLREAAGRSASELAAEIGGLAARMASRPLRGDSDGPRINQGDGLELRAASAIAVALTELAELGLLAPGPSEVARAIEDLRFRVWSGPVEGRVRIASPYRLRAGRFDHVVVGSLQDGEFPRHDRAADPFLSEAQRQSLGLDPRREGEAEERYLFHACLALPRTSLALSYRESDENGAAEARSPFLDEVRGLLAPAPEETGEDPVEAAITVARGLAEVVVPAAEAASENELARAVAAHGAAADPGALLAAAGVAGEVAERVAGRIAAARRVEAASLAPGPLRNPAVLESLAATPAFGGTTLEEFDVCSYRWFAGHELDPQLLEPLPDPLIQGGLMHASLERLYRERPGGDPLPRPGSLEAWQRRGRELVAEVAAERELGPHPAERAMERRVERLLERFLAEEATRETGGFEPWLLEAGFGERVDAERPALDLGGWALHGAIDRVDRDAEGRALVLDYKLSGSVTPREKLEERAKLQLPLYLLAVARHWGGIPIGGLYHPLRGTSSRRPRGVVESEAAGALASYGLYDRDVVDAEGLEELLEESRRRAGEIVARIGAGEIRRDPGPRAGLRGHDVCPTWCTFASICRRDRAPRYEEDEEVEER